MVIADPNVDMNSLISPAVILRMIVTTLVCVYSA
jgi:hypothetical protein